MFATTKVEWHLVHERFTYYYYTFFPLVFLSLFSFHDKNKNGDYRTIKNLYG